MVAGAFRGRRRALCDQFRFRALHHNPAAVLVHVKQRHRVLPFDEGRQRNIDLGDDAVAAGGVVRLLAVGALQVEHARWVFERDDALGAGPRAQLLPPGLPPDLPLSRAARFRVCSRASRSKSSCGR